ncbi:MAG: hypothetical protein FWG46_01465 [Treponema sp.]|nr:hypothetical protein [Treponema sp.]
MKNAIKLLGIIALAAIIGFSMASCDDGGGDPPTGMEELNFTGQQVYTEDFNEETFKLSYTAFNGTLNLTDYMGGTGSVTTGGKLSYTKGTPTATYLNDLTNWLDDLDDQGYTEITPATTSVKCATLDAFEISGTSNYYSMTKEYYSMSGNEASGSYTFTNVRYVYVTDDILITAKGYTDNGSEVDEGFTYSWNDTYRNISLNLKKGWNAVYSKSTGAGTRTASGSTSTRTIEVAVGDPSNTRWVLNGDNDD